jgi:protein-tyrosine-phosphatase
MERWKHSILLDRRSMALGLLLVAGRARAQTSCAPPVVLFVCPAGSVKSAIAREMLRKRAATAGVRVQAQSRGIHPEDHVSPGLAANLKADGIDPASEAARTFVGTDAARADIVIAFDEATKIPALSRPGPGTFPRGIPITLRPRPHSPRASTIFWPSCARVRTPGVREPIGDPDSSGRRHPRRCAGLHGRLPGQVRVVGTPGP